MIRGKGNPWMDRDVRATDDPLMLNRPGMISIWWLLIFILFILILEIIKIGGFI